ncbi:MAG: hypothetical protein IKR51_01460 [Oscillospiraceae bacterium]|nr:hypothetical protein [Oscillospiraceae bacterium]
MITFRKVLKIVLTVVVLGAVCFFILNYALVTKREFTGEYKELTSTQNAAVTLKYRTVPYLLRGELKGKLLVHSEHDRWRENDRWEEFDFIGSEYKNYFLNQDGKDSGMKIASVECYFAPRNSFISTKFYYDGKKTVLFIRSDEIVFRSDGWDLPDPE